MTRENLNWRSFDDQSDVGINQQWNSPATPTTYIIDHQGVIRYKWVGKASEKTIDMALEKMLQANEPMPMK